MNKTKGPPTDPILAGVGKALERTAKNALLLSLQTNTPFYVYEDGKIVDLTKRPPYVPLAREDEGLSTKPAH